MAKAKLALSPFAVNSAVSNGYEISNAVGGLRRDKAGT